MARDYMCDYKTAQKNLHWPMICMIMRSRANLSVIPMQDYLGLDNKARLNQPSTVGKNWKWRVTEEQISEELKDKVRNLTKMYGRINWQWDDKLDA
jgi:4-alpha-glucanotransferase